MDSLEFPQGGLHSPLYYSNSEPRNQKFDHDWGSILADGNGFIEVGSWPVN
jgi:hypothetical protein